MFGIGSGLFLEGGFLYKFELYSFAMEASFSQREAKHHSVPLVAVSLIIFASRELIRAPKLHLNYITAL